MDHLAFHYAELANDEAFTTVEEIASGCPYA